MSGWKCMLDHPVLLLLLGTRRTELGVGGALVLQYLDVNVVDVNRGCHGYCIASGKANPSYSSNPYGLCILPNATLSTHPPDPILSVVYFVSWFLLKIWV